MDFTGYSFRNLLDLKSNDFLFKNLSINEISYPNRLIVSGEGKTFPFIFSGGKVFDNLNNFVWSFNSGEPFDLRFQLDGDIYQYYVNSSLLGNGYRENFKIEKLIIDTTGFGLSFDPVFSSEKIALSMSVDDSFNAGSNLGFTLKNLSSSKIKVFSSSITPYQQSAKEVSFEANQTGILSGGKTLVFSSKDITDNYNSYDNFTFSLDLNSNAGTFSFPLITNRVSNVNGSFVNYTYPEGPLIQQYFGGITGLNSFVFEREETVSDYSMNIQKRDLYGGILTCTGFLGFNIGGFSGNNTGVFITGISFSNSGLYNGIPSVVFSSFSGVESITVNEKNLISYEAGDSFSLLFSGNGTGVSATAYTERVLINLFSGDNPSHKFRTITGVSINNAGSGFNGSYGVFMSGSVVDYPYSYADDIASSLGYLPVSFVTSFKTTAGFASGKALLSSGSSGQLSGVIIFGAGSGYDNGIQLPSVSFKRDALDFFSSNASGSCLMNSSGETISLLNNWEVLAGRSFSNSESDYSLELKTGVSGLYFGPIEFSNGEKDLFIKVKSKNFTSYQQTSLDFQLYETGNAERNFSIVKNNIYTIEEDPVFFEEIPFGEDLIIEEE